MRSLPTNLYKLLEFQDCFSLRSLPRNNVLYATKKPSAIAEGLTFIGKMNF